MRKGDEVNISETGQQILKSLEEVGPGTSYQLSERLGVKTKTVCGSLSQLARRGLTTSRYNTLEDKTIEVIQEITPAGKEFLCATTSN